MRPGIACRAEQAREHREDRQQDQRRRAERDSPEKSNSLKIKHS
jgi:hypothetical protein